jgi:glycosyltransferase involved in cell wall biosynthesis
LRRYLRGRSQARYAVISVTPPIFHVEHWIHGRPRTDTALAPLFRTLRGDRAYFIYNWQWHLDDPAVARAVKAVENRHHRRHPGHEFVHLCNTTTHYDVFAQAGLTAVFFNQNALVDERIFRPLPGIAKRFDAVYDARLTPYKRHSLAAEVRNLALLYAYYEGLEDQAHAESTQRLLSDTHRFNQEPGGAYRSLEPEEVNRCLNECRVGLCLSKIEGSMYASIQYLLAGLPVVSTESQGGRDLFFDEETALIVDADPTAVRAGVEEMLRRNASPGDIRARTLEKVRPHRQAFIDTVQSIYDREGAGRRFADEWQAVFFNKLVRTQRHADTIARLDAVERTRRSS